MLLLFTERLREQLRSTLSARQQHVFLDHTPAREVECLPILGTGKLVLKGIKEIASGGYGWLMWLKDEL
ncbi:MAG: hypothetical protein PHH91_08390 [Desulfuromonadaceae bacterium]|nr:hypothetical protein [Desulfuromonadaceae bacterium]